MIFLNKKSILTIIIFNLIFANYSEDLNESVEYIIDGNYIYKALITIKVFEDTNKNPLGMYMLNQLLHI